MIRNIWGVAAVAEALSPSLRLDADGNLVRGNIVLAKPILDLADMGRTADNTSPPATMRPSNAFIDVTLQKWQLTKEGSAKIAEMVPNEAMAEVIQKVATKPDNMRDHGHLSDLSVLKIDPNATDKDIPSEATYIILANYKGKETPKGARSEGNLDFFTADGKKAGFIALRKATEPDQSLAIAGKSLIERALGLG